MSAKSDKREQKTSDESVGVVLAPLNPFASSLYAKTWSGAIVFCIIQTVHLRFIAKRPRTESELRPPSRLLFFICLFRVIIRIRCRFFSSVSFSACNFLCSLAFIYSFEIEDLALTNEHSWFIWAERTEWLAGGRAYHPHSYIYAIIYHSKELMIYWHFEMFSISWTSLLFRV